jgi:hypothetical protein
VRGGASANANVNANANANVSAVKERAAAYETTALALRLLPEPRRVIVTTKRRRGQPMPVRYRERLTGGARARRGLPLVEIIAAAGPDRVSVGSGEELPVSRAYWTCLTDEALVLLFRDEGREERSSIEGTVPAADGDDDWFLHGWWD